MQYGKQLRENYRAFKNKQCEQTDGPKDRYVNYNVSNVSRIAFQLRGLSRTRRETLCPVRATPLESLSIGGSRLAIRDFISRSRKHTPGVSKEKKKKKKKKKKRKRKENSEWGKEARRNSVE